MKPNRERSERREAGNPPPPPSPPSKSRKTIGGSGSAGVEMAELGEPRWPWLPPEEVVDTVFAPGNTVTVTNIPSIPAGATIYASSRPGIDRYTAHISETEAKIAQDHLNAAIKACYLAQDLHALRAIRAAMDVLKMKEDQ